MRYSLGSFYDHLSEWQNEFSNIETVAVVVTVKEVYGENRKTRSGRCLKTLDHVRIKHLAESCKIPLRPKTVSVTVKGFACDGYDISGAKTSDFVCSHDCTGQVTHLIEGLFRSGGDDESAYDVPGYFFDDFY
jgi:hypothetical protein